MKHLGPFLALALLTCGLLHADTLYIGDGQWELQGESGDVTGNGGLSLPGGSWEERGLSLQVQALQRYRYSIALPDLGHDRSSLVESR